MGVKWYCVVILTCISLGANDISHLYTLFGKMYIQIFCPFKNWGYLFL